LRLAAAQSSRRQAAQQAAVRTAYKTLASPCLVQPCWRSNLRERRRLQHGASSVRGATRGVLVPFCADRAMPARRVANGYPVDFLNVTHAAAVRVQQNRRSCARRRPARLPRCAMRPCASLDVQPSTGRGLWRACFAGWRREGSSRWSFVPRCEVRAAPAFARAAASPACAPTSPHRPSFVRRSERCCSNAQEHAVSGVTGLQSGCYRSGSGFPRLCRPWHCCSICRT